MVYKTKTRHSTGFCRMAGQVFGFDHDGLSQWLNALVSAMSFLGLGPTPILRIGASNMSAAKSKTTTPMFNGINAI